MIPVSRKALEEAEIIVGYRTYIQLIQPFFPSKEFISKGMHQETERCIVALDKAREGKKVALISSGDAGIYGMAGLALEICKKENIEVYPEDEGKGQILLKILPGVSAVNAVSAILGAPLMHDFASISLSDHLTPWNLIEKRIRLASEGDFVIALYNPRSKTRPHLLEKAIEIILRHREKTTPVGIVWNAMRENQRKLITSLEKIPAEEVNMHSTLIIGNSQTYVWNGWMITPRGYHLKKNIF